MNQPPVPPPVQRPFVEPPPIVGRVVEPPAVQPEQRDRETGRGGGSWQWWPDHPGKRVMLLAAACWLGLLIPVYGLGLSMPYRATYRPSPDSFYIATENESLLFTEQEMVEMSSAAGASYVMRFTAGCAFAVAIGSVMVLAIQRKD